MIFATTLQPQTNGLYIVVSVHAPTVVEIMVTIITRSPMTKPALHRTRLSFKGRGIIKHVMVAAVEDILMVAKINKVVGSRNRTSLEWQTLSTLLTMEFTVLMGFGWLLVANIIPGVALPMLTPLVSMMLSLGWGQLPSPYSLALICSTTMVPASIMALELQLLLWIPQLWFQGRELLPPMILFKSQS